jgi:glutathione-regulated potassium-efflux system ancillary protein KefC
MVSLGTRPVATSHAGKVFPKIFGLYPIIGVFRQKRDERWYYTLLMSTGLTFGTISALFGLSHKNVTQQQYSFSCRGGDSQRSNSRADRRIVFLPRHLLLAIEQSKESLPAEDELSEEG